MSGAIALQMAATSQAGAAPMSGTFRRGHRAGRAAVQVVVVLLRLVYGRFDGTCKPLEEIAEVSPRLLHGDVTASVRFQIRLLVRAEHLAHTVCGGGRVLSLTMGWSSQESAAPASNRTALALVPVLDAFRAPIEMSLQEDDPRMRIAFRSSALAVAALLLVSVARADLQSFIRKPEPAYRWRLESTTRMGNVSVYKLHLVSQVWHGFTWEHDLVLFRPDGSAHPEFCGIHNTGGKAGGETMAIGSLLARQTGMSFAVLFGIPMQPIWDKHEDALIVATWQKYLETGDATWPLHFPMAKAVIKSMDALQQFSTKQLKSPLTKFAINGASKRGWTTWLVGAAQDKRVVAIAPMVIDVLRVAKQIPHQLAMLGQPSEQIEDYSGSGMLKLLSTPRGQALMKLEDPYSYREKLTLPKLLILGTNDRYWAQDALNLYWDGLKGPKWVLYTPNSGHGLDDRMRVFGTLTAFLRSVAANKPWPKLSWKHSGPASAPKLTVVSDTAPVSARVWRVESATTDFRDSKWSSTPVPVSGRRIAASLEPAPPGQYAASYMEMTFRDGAREFNLSTQLRVLPNTK